MNEGSRGGPDPSWAGFTAKEIRKSITNFSQLLKVILFTSNSIYNIHSFNS